MPLPFHLFPPSLCGGHYLIRLPHKATDQYFNLALRASSSWICKKTRMLQRFFIESLIRDGAMIY